MKIAIIGASKGTGFETVKRALDREHEVFALSRSGINSIQNPKLHNIIGSAIDKKIIKELINQTDALVVTLGQGQSFKATTLMTDFAKLLIDINKESKIEKPIIILSGFGAGDSLNYNKFIPKMVFKTLLKKVYSDKNNMEELISSSQLNWIITRPGMLTNNELTEKYRVEDHLFEGINIGKISRADVADFMVKQAEKPEYIHKFVSMTS